MTYFESQRTRLHLFGSSSNGASSQGLRVAQSGAVFAMAAHFGVSDEPAIASMPTGSGKSASISLLPFMLPAKKVLVVVPSRIVLEQLSSEFSSLGTLRRVGVVADDVVGPRVKVVNSKVSSTQNWTDLAADHDVLLGTPKVLSPAMDGVAALPLEAFDLLIFDEAHHVPAKTYTAILEALPVSRCALFTATPFRRDKQALPGRIVYSYTLRQALADGILSPINFVPVEVGSEVSREARDNALASAARGRLRSEEHARVDSRIIARTRTIAHAQDLVGVYARVGLSLGLVTATTTRDALREIVGGVRDGDLDGLISVGAMGEGFDLPRLKIGVYHQPHSSLPPTLQFLGRITRILPEAPPAELLAIREDVSEETSELYSADGAWADLVPQLSDAAVAEEGVRREYLRSFDPLPMRPLSLAALRPRKYVQIFELSPEQANSLNMECTIVRIDDGEVIYKGVDADGRVAVTISEHLDRPEWLDADTLDRYRYELHALVVDPGRRFLFVLGARDKTIKEYLRNFGVDEPRTVDALWLDRLMASIKVDGYFSLGMRSARAVGERVAAYRQMAGQSVGGAVSATETRMYGTGHAIAKVRDPMRVTAEQVRTGEVPTGAPTTSIGISYGRARVFSPDLVHLPEFRKWCDRLVALVDAQSDLFPAGLPNVSLRSPRRFNEFPRNPYLCTVEPALLGGGYVVESQSGLVSLAECEIVVTTHLGTALEVTLIGDQGDLWQGRLLAGGEVQSVGPVATITTAGVAPGVPLHEFFEEAAPQIFYADGTSTIGPMLFQAHADYPDLPEGRLSVWTFENVDVTKESLPAELPTQLNVKQYATQRILQECEPQYIVDDDRANEVSDLVAIGWRESEMSGRGTWVVRLVHTKFTSNDPPGFRIDELYVLGGQAARSARWCDSAKLASRLKKRIASGSMVLHGKTGDLLEILGSWEASPANCEFEVWAIQPGLKIDGLNSRLNVKILLNDVRDWIAGHGAEFRVVGRNAQM